MKRTGKIRRFLALAAAAALALTACGPKASAATMHLRRTVGAVAVADGAGRQVEPREALGLYSSYQVDTQSESYAWIDLDEVKLTKMDQNSGIQIQKEGKRLEILVNSGSLFFNVTQPLAEDETLEIRTSSMVVGIRGTCGWITQDAAALLEGTVKVTTEEQSVTISAGEMAVMTADGALDVVEFSDQDIPAFVFAELKDGEGPSGSSPDTTPWASAGLTDHVMDWRDEVLAAKMAEITGITDREIMLSDVWGLVKLDLQSAGISNISALGELTNLTKLWLSENNISDISGLSSLTSLQELSLDGNNISDVSGLSSLKNLKNLVLSFNNISDINALSGLMNLELLYLAENNISDINALGGLTNLARLNLVVNNISNVSALSGLTNLQYLDLRGNHITDYSPVEFVPTLNK